uniref:Uncharacterized protein n=1 Tax=Colobus angolensis palliatus TaxID=336983 RepID=A0A2K5I4D3_COLAP
MRQMMELDPELLLQEALENVELGHQLEGLWESASQTRDVLKQHINDLKGTLAKLLDERLVTLLQEVGTIKQTIKSPLDDCQKLIEHRVNTPEALVRKGEIATVGGVGEENEKLWSFTKKALHYNGVMWMTTLRHKMTGSSFVNVLQIILRMYM